MTGKKGSRATTTARALEIQTWAMEMRLAGSTERQIAAQFPSRFPEWGTISQTTIHRHLQHERAERTALRDETRDELITRDLDTLDALLRGVADLLAPTVLVEVDGAMIEVPQKPEVRLAAHNAAIRNLERRAKILGTDSPTKVEAQVQVVDYADLEISKLVEQMRADDEKAAKKARKRARKTGKVG